MVVRPTIDWDHIHEKCANIAIPPPDEGLFTLDKK